MVPLHMMPIIASIVIAGSILFAAGCLFRAQTVCASGLSYNEKKQKVMFLQTGIFLSGFLILAIFALLKYSV